MVLPRPEELNIKHPEIYRLTISDGGEEYIFVTDEGACYKIVFVEDYTLGEFIVYQLVIELAGGSIGRRDNKIKGTVSCIIEAFLRENETGLLYICDTADGRQAARDRLFSKWFNDFAENDHYTLKHESLEVEGCMYFMSMLIRNDNPLYTPMIQAFDRTCDELKSKLK